MSISESPTAVSAPTARKSARWTLLAIAIVVCCCPVWTGCGSDRPEMVPVSGKVTYGGGAWPKEGILYFVAVENAPGKPARSVSAPFDTEGNFSAEAFKGDKGLFPGKYKVTVECWETPPSMGGDSDTSSTPKSYVPVKFQSATTTPLELTVETGSSAKTVTFEVPKP